MLRASSRARTTRASSGRSTGPKTAGRTTRSATTVVQTRTAQSQTTVANSSARCTRNPVRRIVTAPRVARDSAGEDNFTVSHDDDGDDIVLLPLRPTHVKDPDCLVVEKMLPGYEDEPDTVTASTLPNQGGLHAKRLKFVDTVYTIALSCRGVYGVDQLRRSAHYTLRGGVMSLKVIQAEIKRIQEAFPHIKYIHIGADECFEEPTAESDGIRDPSDDGVTVYNYQSEDCPVSATNLLDDIDLSDHKSLLPYCSKEKRGNFTLHGGYSSQSYTRNRDQRTKSISQPAAFAANEKHQSLLQHYPRICRFIDSTPVFERQFVQRRREHFDEDYVSLRADLFSHQINGGNPYFEANTFGGNVLHEGTARIPKVMGVDTRSLKIHVDKHNDSRPGYSSQVTIHRQYLVVSKTDEEEARALLEQDDFDPFRQDRFSVVRLFEAFYCKKEVGLFMERRKWQHPIISRVEQYIDEQAEPWKMTVPTIVQHLHATNDMLNVFDNDTRQRVGNGIRLPQGVYQFDRVYTKSWNIGILHDCIRQVHDHFHLFKYQAMELVFCTVFVTTPVMFYKVCKKWMTEDDLPTGSLIKGFLETAKEIVFEDSNAAGNITTNVNMNRLYGGKQLTRNTFAKPTQLWILEEGLAYIWKHLPTWNSMTVDWRNRGPCWKNIQEVLIGSLYNVGELQAHTLLHLMIRLEIIKQPLLGSYAAISTSTKTFSRLHDVLKDDADYSAADARDILKDFINRDQLLRAMAHQFDTTVEVAEHVLCKALRDGDGAVPTHDVAIDGMSTSWYVKNGNNNRLEKIDISSGEVSVYDSPRWKSEKAKRNAPSLKEVKQSVGDVYHWRLRDFDMDKDPDDDTWKGIDGLEIIAISDDEIIDEHSLSLPALWSFSLPKKGRRVCQKRKTTTEVVEYTQAVVERFYGPDEKSAPGKMPYVPGQLTYEESKKVFDDRKKTKSTRFWPSRWGMGGTTLSTIESALHGSVNVAIQETNNLSGVATRSQQQARRQSRWGPRLVNLSPVRGGHLSATTGHSDTNRMATAHGNTPLEQITVAATEQALPTNHSYPPSIASNPNSFLPGEITMALRNFGGRRQWDRVDPAQLQVESGRTKISRKYLLEMDEGGNPKKVRRLTTVVYDDHVRLY